MGCLNSEGDFDHWFGNIHLSGPCNRSCYFCIGQHMMELDNYDSLSVSPDEMDGFERFIKECKKRDVDEINLTGTNTEPLLYSHHEKLTKRLRDEFDNLTLGLRSNGTLVERKPEVWNLYDKASITICSTDPDIYKEMMGQGEPPDLQKIVNLSKNMDLKVNCVLGPENQGLDILKTIAYTGDCGVPRINLREPYGQPRVGNPLRNIEKDDTIFGNPQYNIFDTEATYWDVHYTKVESVNLYANGRVSIDYPITEGHSENGQVEPQEEFDEYGRKREQWV